MRADPDRFAILDWFPLVRPESRNVVAAPGRAGRAFYFNQPHKQSRPTDGRLDWLWPTAEEAGLRAAKGEAAYRNLPQLIALRSIQTSRSSIHPHLRQVYDAFGPQRMFWGTDITRMP